MNNNEGSQPETTQEFSENSVLPTAEANESPETFLPQIFGDLRTLSVWFVIVAAVFLIGVLISAAEMLMNFYQGVIFEGIQNAILIGLIFSAAVHLIRCGRNLKEYTNTHNPEHLTTALYYMKRFFATWGVYIIMAIVFSIISFAATYFVGRLM